jgi:hypothetical protein
MNSSLPQSSFRFSQLPVCLDENYKGDERHTSIKKFVASAMFKKTFRATASWNRDFFPLSSVEKITAAQRVQLAHENVRRSGLAVDL